MVRALAMVCVTAMLATLGLAHARAPSQNADPSETPQDTSNAARVSPAPLRCRRSVHVDLSGRGLKGDITILSVSERPPFAWGVVAVWVRLEVETAEGTGETIYLPYMSQDQVLPSPGSACFVVARELSLFQRSGDLGLVASILRCGGVDYRPLR